MTRRGELRILFLLSFGVFILARFLFGGQETLSFNLFKDWTIKQNVKLGESYVKNSSVDDAVVGTVLSQISFGNGSYKAPPTSNNVFALFAHSQALVNTDILQLLKTTDLPERALQMHLDHTQETITQIEESSESLNLLASTHLTLSKECLEKKRAGDRKFFDGANKGDDPLADEGLAISLDNAPCYITNRIQANAYSYLSQKVQTHATLLTQREQLLSTNQDMLVNNSDYFEGDILNQLVSLKGQLASVNSVSYSSFDGVFNGVFNLDHLDADYELPTYQRIWFEPKKIPTYDEPGLDTILGLLFNDGLS